MAALTNIRCNIARNLERNLEDSVKSGELRLSNRKLKDFPKTFAKFNLQDLIYADLSRNRFCELPEEVTTFIFLERLLLYHNAIKIIPQSIRSLTSLTFLDLRSNQLICLPRELCFLPIQILLVSNNKLIQLPEELGKMTELTELDAGCNQLSHLPTRLCELNKLRSLCLRNNQINFIPKELATLNLVYLNLGCNRISSLPLEIRLMTDLIELDLSDNPLTSPPAHLCSKGIVFIFKYLDNAASKDLKSDLTNSLRRPIGNKKSHYIYDNKKSKANSPDNVDYNFEQFAKLEITPTPFHLRTEFSKSDTSTPTSMFPTNGISESLLDNELLKRKLENRIVIKSDPTSMNNISILSDIIPAKLLENQKTPEKLKSIETIQTYREYKEALKQQRNTDVYSVYKTKEKVSIDRSDSETSNLNENLDGNNDNNEESIKHRENTQKSILVQNNDKNVQNGNNKGIYTKPNSPFKTPKSNGQTRLSFMNNSKVLINSRSKSTANNDCNRSWDNEGNEKLSFTMRREFDRHREEEELMNQLKTIIETKLKMVLPEDVSAALNDGVILCHLANHVRPQSVGSIHIPSANVPKLTMARCRRNVDNFLDACRKIGVDEDEDTSKPATSKESLKSFLNHLQQLEDAIDTEEFYNYSIISDYLAVNTLNSLKKIDGISNDEKMLSNILLTIFILTLFIAIFSSEIWY